MSVLLLLLALALPAPAAAKPGVTAEYLELTGSTSPVRLEAAQSLLVRLDEIRGIVRKSAAARPAPAPSLEAEDLPPAEQVERLASVLKRMEGSPEDGRYAQDRADALSLLDAMTRRVEGLLTLKSKVKRARKTSAEGAAVSCHESREFLAGYRIDLPCWEGIDPPAPLPGPASRPLSGTFSRDMRMRFGPKNAKTPSWASEKPDFRVREGKRLECGRVMAPACFAQGEGWTYGTRETCAQWMEHWRPRLPGKITAPLRPVDKVGDAPAPDEYRLEYLYRTNGPLGNVEAPMAMRLLCLRGAGALHIVRFEAPETAFDDLRPVLERMRRSFALTSSAR